MSTVMVPVYASISIFNRVYIHAPHTSQACNVYIRVHMHNLHIIIPYSGKLSREKTFTNFAIFQPSAKVFSTKI